MNPTLPDALAHCLSTDAKTRPLDVEGLGVFHVRTYGEGAKHKTGVLFLAGKELRVALAGGDEEDADDDPENDPQRLIADASKTPISFGEWLARTSQKGPDWAARELAQLSVTVKKKLAAGEELDFPALGKFTTKRMAAMTVHTENSSRESRERLAACFTPSDALRRRLERTPTKA